MQSMTSMLEMQREESIFPHEEDKTQPTNHRDKRGVRRTSTFWLTVVMGGLVASHFW